MALIGFVLTKKVAMWKPYLAYVMANLLSGGIYFAVNGAFVDLFLNSWIYFCIFACLG